jgi:TPR repeat protein
MHFVRIARLGALFLATVLSFPSLASPLEDANAAYVNGDFATALPLLRDLAQQGDARSQTRLGLMYRDGRGVARDPVESVAWFRKAAEQGYAAGQTNLGLMYSQGQGVPRDDAEATTWYRKAAEQKYAWGQNNLGNMYARGRGVERDDAEAVQWYRKAAEQGFAIAQDNLGVMYRDGRGVNQDFVAAVDWFRKGAENGNAEAQNNLGFMYEHGRGLAKDDTEAAKQYQKAAVQGNALGQCNLGNMYRDGRGGLPQDDQRAVEWYRKSALQGYAAAQTSLGLMYATGRGVPKSESEAAQWYGKAAEQGDATARTLLNSMQRVWGKKDGDEATYAVLSLIGDKISLVGHAKTVGSHVDQNLHETITMNSRALDNAAVLAASNAVKRVDARATTVMMTSNDPKLYELQQRLFEGQDESNALLGSVKAMLLGQNATHLVLITKHRGDARLRLAHEYVGSGTIEGVGFYSDSSYAVRDSEKGGLGNGFLAPFAYVRVTLVDVKTMAVIRQRSVEESTTLSNAHAKGSLSPWDILTAEQKVTTLQKIIGAAMDRVVPEVVAGK